MSQRLRSQTLFIRKEFHKVHDFLYVKSLSMTFIKLSVIIINYNYYFKIIRPISLLKIDTYNVNKDITY